VVCGAPSSQRCVNNGFFGVKTVISSGDASERIVKAMDELRDFVSKVYNNTVK
jgi:hypothetical protein